MATKSKAKSHTWNYRIVEHITSDDRKWYAIHEVHYEDDKPTGMTSEPITFAADPLPEGDLSIELEAQHELLGALLMAARDCLRHPIFVPPKEWDETAKKS